jgi:hypothetical protein
MISIGSMVPPLFIRVAGSTGAGSSAPRCRRCSWPQPIITPIGPRSGFQWERYGPDLLLVNIAPGQVVDTIYDAFY